MNAPNLGTLRLPARVDPEISDKTRAELEVWNDLEDNQKCQDAQVAFNEEQAIQERLKARAAGDKSPNRRQNLPEDNPSVATPAATTASVSLLTSSQASLGSE